ncbi:MAG: von Willebrand factor type A domain-containing protein, partial [Rhodocyclaceae bacterium]|nr:von Willebrand factor type A domain-containing protein [Rhodocyclaceae bacterium]
MTRSLTDPRRPATIAVAILLAACAGQPELAPPPSADAAPAGARQAPAQPASPVETTPAAAPASAELADQAIAPAPAPQQPAAGRLLSLHHARKATEARTAGRIAAPAALPAMQPISPPPVADRERYQRIDDNPVKLVAAEPVSTFSIDVDTGSYANVRRMLTAGQLPPKDAVRVEEMINYFPYDYPRPTGAEPFAVHTELAASPWNTGNLLLRVALKGQDLAAETLPPVNLVFLVDVSGSMNSPDKLPLLKSALKLMVDRLRPEDRISLVTYSGGTRVVLEATP